MTSESNSTRFGAKASAAGVSLAGFLELIRGSKITKFEPALKPKIGFSYVGLEKKALEAQLETLSSLEKEGLVSQKGFTIAMKCPDCSSYNLCFRLACQSCGSGNILKGNVIEHISCGNTDFDERYLDESGRLMCKKCSKRLNALGVDYSRPGFFYRCNACKALLPAAKEFFTCIGCGNDFQKEDLAILKLPTYSVEMDVLEKFTEGMGSIIESLSQELARRGVRVIHPASIPGASGISQTFSIAMYSDQNLPIMVGDAAEQFPSHETAILSLFAKSIDAGIRHHVLLTHEEIDPKSKSLATAYGIMIVKIDPLDMQSSAWRCADLLFESYQKITNVNKQKLSVEGH